MSFTIACTAKGCGKLMQPYIDPDTDKVHCSSCDSELLQVTPFVKHQLKMNKKYRPKKSIPFAVKCANCGREDRPLLLGDKDIICPACKKVHSNLSEPFKIVLRENLKTVDKDV
jgi:hypothetical protein